MKRTALALSILLLSTAAVPAQEKPNIVVMLVDNLGWGELGSYGGGVLRGAETPRLDTLAAEGMRFLNFNVEPQCTPSRSALMTGRHPIRSGTTKVVWGMLYGMTQWERTIAELLSDEGRKGGSQRRRFLRHHRAAHRRRRDVHRVDELRARQRQRTGGSVAALAQVASASWSCVAAGGASCTAGPVVGDIGDTTNIPVGGSAT